MMDRTRNKAQPIPLILSMAALSIILLLTGCGSDGKQGGNQETSAPKQEEKAEHGHGKMQELDDFYFEPKTVKVKQGEQATLTLHNEGKKEHTFTVKELGIDEEVEPGKSKPVTIEGKKPGTYHLICTYHANMRGKVIVEE